MMSRSNKIRGLSKLYLDCKTEKARNRIVQDIIKLNRPFTIHFAKRSGVLDNLDDFEQNFSLFLLKDFKNFDPKKGDVFKFLIKIYYKAQNATLRSDGVMGWVPENYYRDPENKLGRTQKFREIKTKSLDELTYNEDSNQSGAKTWLDFILVDHVDNENAYEKIMQKAVTTSFITIEDKKLLDCVIVDEYHYDIIGEKYNVTRQAIHQKLSRIKRKVKLFIEVYKTELL